MVCSHRTQHLTLLLLLVVSSCFGQEPENNMPEADFMQGMSPVQMATRFVAMLGPVLGPVFVFALCLALFGYVAHAMLSAIRQAHDDATEEAIYGGGEARYGRFDGEGAFHRNRSGGMRRTTDFDRDDDGDDDGNNY